MNLKTNVIKWLAIGTMTVDHLGYYVFPELFMLRIIGRLAFPLFLYTTVQGVKQTSDFSSYLGRLVGMAIVSALLLRPIRLYWNILFTLALFALSLKDKRLFLPALFLAYFTEYSIYGFLFGWSIKIMVDQSRWVGLLLIIGLHVVAAYPSIQLFAVLAVPLMLLPLEWQWPKFPKWLGYLYYPLHQLLLFWVGTR